MWRAILFAAVVTALAVPASAQKDSGQVYKETVWSVPWITCTIKGRLLSSGSGVVFNRRGNHVLVFTCAHVVEGALSLSKKERDELHYDILAYFPHPNKRGDPVVDDPEKIGDPRSDVFGAKATITGVFRNYVGLASIAAVDSKKDLAVLDVFFVGEPPERIRPVIDFGKLPRKGDRLHIIGSPGNRPQWRSTLGEFKSFEQFTGRYRDDPYDRDYFALRFYSASWEGNSGGPVLDSQGKLVGILSAGTLKDGGLSTAVSIGEGLAVFKAATTKLKLLPSK